MHAIELVKFTLRSHTTRAGPVSGKWGGLSGYDGIRIKLPHNIYCKNRDQVKYTDP